MSKIGVAPFQASHTGKSGYIATSPRGTPKPFPFSIVEQGIINSYPKYRKFLPTSIHQYSDEIYDFRQLPYKEYYDKYGKKHINRWWVQQLDAISFYETQKQKALQDWKFGNTRTKYNARNSIQRSQYTVYNRKSKHLRCGKCKLKYRGTGQRPYCKCRSSRRKAKPRLYYSRYYR